MNAAGVFCVLQVNRGFEMSIASIPIRTASLVAAMAVAQILSAHEFEPPPTAANAAIQSTNEASFRAAGKAASLTVAPTVTAGKPIPKVGEVVALMLERGGMPNLETSTVAFLPPKGADLASAASAFSTFVRANPPSTDYILYTEFQGVPGKGVSEVRAVVATKNGDIVWKDRQAPGDKDFDRIKPKEPIQCCLLITERLRPVLGLSKSPQGDAEGGKIAERFRRETGVPDKTETAAIESRGKTFKKSAAKSSLIVYPVRVGGAFSAESASNVAATLNGRKFTKAKSVADGPTFETAGDINEQKVLWSTARSFSAHIQKNPPEADYVVFADYLMKQNGVGAVHFVVCNRKGELVVVDYQNEHSADFKAINPTTREDCDRLLAKRLESYSR